jgi:hypothetical protein
VGGLVVAPIMKVSASKKVAGYVRVAWQARISQTRLIVKEAKLAPLRAKVEREALFLAVRRDKLTGTQRAEAERILAAYPSRRAYIDMVRKKETAGA